MLRSCVSLKLGWVQVRVRGVGWVQVRVRGGLTWTEFVLHWSIERLWTSDLGIHSTTTNVCTRDHRVTQTKTSSKRFSVTILKNDVNPTLRELLQVPYRTWRTSSYVSNNGKHYYMGCIYLTRLRADDGLELAQADLAPGVAEGAIAGDVLEVGLGHVDPVVLYKGGCGGEGRGSDKEVRR